MTESKPTQTRRKGRFVVQGQNPSGTWCDVPETVASTAAGMAWIKHNGEGDYTYRVVNITADPVLVEEETVTKRTLTPVAADAEPEPGAAE